VLDSFANKFRGVVLAAVVLLLSAVFALQFGGPQAEGCASGGQGGAVAEVYGHKITRAEYQAAYTLAGGEGFGDDRAKESKLEQMVLYGLIERSLLAKQAREIGFSVEDEQVLERAAEDGVLHLSISVNAGPMLPRSGPQRFDFKDKDGKFSKDNLKNFIQYRLRRSMLEFTRSQSEETLAQKMRDNVTANVAVAPGEVWDAFVREKESVQLEYVRFSKAYYEQQVTPTEADLTAFIASDKAAVDAEYEKQKARYTGLEKQVRARHILVKVDGAASDEDKAAKRAVIDGLLKRARAGEDFAKLATDNSEDTGSAKNGGDLGYNPKGRMVPEFDEMQFKLKAGEISEVVQTSFGFHVIKVEAIREGDVPQGEAKRELAEKLYKDKKAIELAKAAADALTQKLQGGTLALEDALRASQGLPAPVEGAEEPKKDPLAPEVRQTRPFGRSDTAIPGPFDSSPMVTAGYKLTDAAPLGGAPMQLGDDLFVYKLLSRADADKAAFTTEEQERIRAALTRRKQSEVLDGYVRGLLDRATKDQKVLVDEPAFEALVGAPNLPQS
jgi:peptidyl-prolyl cis-trans isomerase D